MNNFQENLLKTMKIVSDYAVSANENSATVIEGTIITPLDTLNGEYLLDYLGNRIVVYSDAGQYQENDIVYVIVPYNNFSLDKYIIGRKRH